jgi:hypothetical protein
LLGQPFLGTESLDRDVDGRHTTKYTLSVYWMPTR